jgi:hypothetical protein
MVIQKLEEVQQQIGWNPEETCFAGQFANQSGLANSLNLPRFAEWTRKIRSIAESPHISILGLNNLKFYWLKFGRSTRLARREIALALNPISFQENWLTQLVALFVHGPRRNSLAAQGRKSVRGRPDRWQQKSRVFPCEFPRLAIASC